MNMEEHRNQLGIDDDEDDVGNEEDDNGLRGMDDEEDEDEEGEEEEDEEEEEEEEEEEVEEEDDEDYDEELEMEDLGDFIVDEDILEEQEEEEEEEDDYRVAPHRLGQHSNYDDNIFADAPGSGHDLEGAEGPRDNGREEAPELDEGMEEEGALDDMLLAGMQSRSGRGRGGRSRRSSNLMEGEDMDVETMQRIVNESLATGAGGISPDRLNLSVPIVNQGAISAAFSRSTDTGRPSNDPAPGEASFVPTGSSMDSEGVERRTSGVLNSILGGLPPGARVEEITVEDVPRERSASGVPSISFRLPANVTLQGGGGGVLRMIEGLANDVMQGRDGGEGGGNTIENVLAAIAGGGGRGRWRVRSRPNSRNNREDTNLYPRPASHPLVAMTENRTGVGGALERSRLSSSRINNTSTAVGALGETYREDSIWTAQDAHRSQRFSGSITTPQ